MQHAALRVLDVCELTATDLRGMLPLPSDTKHQQFMISVLLPLQSLGLLHLDRQSLTWGTTEAGSTAAFKLGSIDEATPVKGFSDRGPAANDGEPSKLHAPGVMPAPSRPRLGMGTADHMPPAKRPGAMDAMALPSRMGNRLHWPDGSVTKA
jgi:hypothetical protein